MRGKIFNAQEVQSIINKSKVMFREVIKPQPRDELVERHGYWGTGLHDDPRWEKAPYQVGQKIFCKESARSTHETKGGLNPWYGVTYKAGGDKSFYGEKAEPNFPDSIFKNNGELRFAPAKSMPQWASRLTLLIKEIKVERLGEISEEDAIAEGFFPDSTVYYDNVSGTTATEKFIAHWNATHKKPEEKFEASPWVWVVSFEVVK